MDCVGMLLVTVLLISVSASTVQARYTRYYTQFYETIPIDDPLVLKPNPPIKVSNKGEGYVKHNNVLHSSQGYQLGTVSGMYFYHSVNSIEDIVTITFNKNLVAPWSDSSINLRGRWKMTPDGSGDLDDQELSIVGGQEGFRGASGTVYYHRIAMPPNTNGIFLVTCDIYIVDFWSYIPKTHVNIDTQFKSLAEAVKIKPEIPIVTEAADLAVLKSVLESS